MLHPLQAEPALHRGHGLQDALLELVDRAGQGRDEMRNHPILLLLSSPPRFRSAPRRCPARSTEGGEALDADRPARMELVRADADLGAQAVFETVGEARAGVHHHAGRIHLAQVRCACTWSRVRMASVWCEEYG